MNRKQRWKDYEKIVCNMPEGITRAEAAELFGVSKATAKYHLEAAVEAGALEKVAEWATENQIGWVYVQPVFAAQLRGEERSGAYD
jgi:predicted ArsR family transcriptional regulator